jgi:hypothetical protein
VALPFAYLTPSIGRSLAEKWTESSPTGAATTKAFQSYVCLIVPPSASSSSRTEAMWAASTTPTTTELRRTGVVEGLGDAR